MGKLTCDCRIRDLEIISEYERKTRCIKCGRENIETVEVFRLVKDILEIDRSIADLEREL